MECIKIMLTYLYDKLEKSKGTQRLPKSQYRSSKCQLRRPAMASLGRETNLKEMKCRGGEGKD